jgi:hypothetical protein
LVYWPPIVIAGAAAMAVMFVAVATAALVSLVPAGHSGAAAAVALPNPQPLALASEADDPTTPTPAAPVEIITPETLPRLDPSAVNKPPEPIALGPDLALGPGLVEGGACNGAACAAAAAGGRYGTAVAFVDNPADAGGQALKDKKLLFMLHVAGDFEEAKFT